MKLSNGEVGRVFNTNQSPPTRPRVDVLIHPRGCKLPGARQIDLQDQPMIQVVDPAIEEGVSERRI
ncbi:MAG: hypothetical protein VX733_02975 [Candidatus Latescibacterota bacterium]|nr:hypothetical protein [Candidatus Latescibacterota bacterium]